MGGGHTPQKIGVFPKNTGTRSETSKCVDVDGETLVEDVSNALKARLQVFFAVCGGCQEGTVRS